MDVNKMSIINKGSSENLQMMLYLGSYMQNYFEKLQRWKKVKLKKALFKEMIDHILQNKLLKNVFLHIYGIWELS
ncbi:hypothetical protein YYG_04174 [Plasmodium vinckei petteri]|uniref:Uncharacterized protein n=1 Tax=Plasmodium vinckei petteri TaxID=138298 RepID=W7AYT0_PLAVN|nr:hypothetical protein YYG_04174 [Plasmodium vinckei petteri]